MAKSTRCGLILSVLLAAGAADLRGQQPIAADRPKPFAPLRPESAEDLQRREARTLYALGMLRQRQDRLVDALHNLEEARKLVPRPQLVVFAAFQFDPEAAKGYTAGLIILAAAPCTAMVFVWSYLTDGDPAYTLVQVAVNDLIMLVAFAPIVMFLCGVANVIVPAKVLVTSVIVFIVIPLTAGWLTRAALLKLQGKEWFEQKFLPKFHPVMIGALLLTLVLIFAFQSKNLTGRWLAVLLIAVPIVIQVYFNSGLTYLLMRRMRVEQNVAAPGALIGASNFFELAVAVAITLFGADSPAALATVVGVLVEVPIMLSVCNICNQSRDWYNKKPHGAL